MFGVADLGIADYGAFVVAVIVFLAIPGVGNLAIITSTSKGRLPGGLAATLGVIVADQILMWLAVAGVSAILLAHPAVFGAVQYAGAIYLAYLGVRMILAKPGDAPVLGMLARFHPQKDHRNFVRAAGLIRRQRDDARFLLCGWSMDWDNTELVSWIDAAGLRDRFHLVPRRPDANRVQASLDLAVLSSQGGEAMPLTIGEAMACGVPCAVTDVGDAALLVGDTGRVAPPRDPDALAAACLDLLNLSADERTRLGRAARARIAERYSLSQIAAEYARLHGQLAARTDLCLA